MSTQTTTEAPAEGALASQVKFEATFPAGHAPKTDTRRPGDVAWPWLLAEREGWMWTS